MNTYEFLITSLIIILIPGTGVVYTISTGLSSGKKSSVLAASGCTLGILPHLSVSIILSSFLLKMNGTAFFIIKTAGAVYLLYLGAGMIFSHSSIQFEDADRIKQPLSIIGRGILINLLNPKLTLFFFAFLPQYVCGTGGDYLLQSWIYGLVFMFLTWIVFIGYGLLAGILQHHITGSGKHRLLRQCFGIVFIVFAGKLALSSL